MISIINRAIAKMSRVQMTPRVIGALASAMVILAALIAPPTNIVTDLEVSFWNAVIIYGFIAVMIVAPMATSNTRIGSL